MEKVYDTVTKRTFTIHEPFKVWILNFDSGRYVKVSSNGKPPLNRVQVNTDKHY